jgi:hydroxypyruvate isomerase
MIMQMRHGMPVWAPSDLEMTAIANQVAKERARAAREAVQSVKFLFSNDYDAQAIAQKSSKKAG